MGLWGGDPFKGGIEEGTPVWGPLNEGVGEGPFKRGVFGGTPLMRSFGGAPDVTPPTPHYGAPLSWGAQGGSL